jgi:L,D-peptidoglycan transpeptidase YkuD (ErfK/YbiS/YcfS/YnhG family)
VEIEVRGKQLTAFGKTYTCDIGRNGIAKHKREGDGCTPAGTFPLREVYYRADKMPRPLTQLPITAIHPTNGWCDDVDHPDYNSLVTMPFPGSHERLLRKDNVYDLLVVIGYNDAPTVPGLGSAIFLHVAMPGHPGTSGCVAVSTEELLAIVKDLRPGARIRVRH